MRRTAFHRRLLVALGAAPLLVACAAGPIPAPVPTPTSLDAARAELRSLISDVTAADAYRYGTGDDLGRGMDTAKVIWIPEASTFAAVYHTWSDADQTFQVRLATSLDLMHWSSRVELGTLASQPTIQRGSSGGYVVAWEQEPDPIHIVIESFDTWDDLLAGAAGRRLDVPVTMPACGEGTPSIVTASMARVELGFHYHGGCETDREASGSTDWTTWEASARPERDKALMAAGATGHIGDRDEITFRGHEFVLIEGQLRYEDFSSWRTFLYDQETGLAEQLQIRTHLGSVAFGNPTIEAVNIDGRSALVLGLFLFGEGAPSSEDGELVFVRFVD